MLARACTNVNTVASVQSNLQESVRPARHFPARPLQSAVRAICVDRRLWRCAAASYSGRLSPPISRTQLQLVISQVRYADVCAVINKSGRPEISGVLRRTGQTNCSLKSHDKSASY